MYDIGLSELIITDRLEDDKHLSIKYVAEAATRPTCTNSSCNHKYTLNRHDVTKYLLHDVKAEGKLVFIELNLRRYKCPECQAIISDTFTFFTKRQHMTHRLKNEFVSRCLKGETFRYIANDYSVDSKTVAAAFQEYVDAHKEELNHGYTPEILGIDEAHIDDRYRLVLTDIKNQKLLDMKPNNQTRTVKSYLKTLDKSVCSCVTMDFAPVYAKAVESVLPDALIVIDKFHAVQDVNRCLDNLRKRIQKEHLAKGENIRKFKHSRTLFMANWEDITDEGRNQLKRWFDEIPEFYQGYMCKETFREIYNVAKTREQASEFYDKWLKTIPNCPEFLGMKKTFMRRKEHILNYWDCGFTNAYTESVNNSIKAIEKRGRGYRFERLREMCILEINKPKPEKFNPKDATYISVMNKKEKDRKELYVCSFHGDNSLKNTNNTDYTVILGNGFTLEFLLETYLSIDAEQDCEERMKAYYNKLIEQGVIMS